MLYNPGLVGAFSPSAMYCPVASVVLLPITIGESAVMSIVFELIGVGAPPEETEVPSISLFASTNMLTCQYQTLSPQAGTLPDLLLKFQWISPLNSHARDNKLQLPPLA